MRSENRHYTRVWKKRRKNKLGDLCDNAKCGICSRHKNIGNNKYAVKEKYKFDKNSLLNYEVITLN